jgi:hypothetical protein
MTWHKRTRARRTRSTTVLPPSPPQPPKPQCRICTEEGNLPSNPLFRPCRCKGSIEYVHRKCLDRWRMESLAPYPEPRNRKLRECMTCNYTYRYEHGHRGFHTLCYMCMIDLPYGDIVVTTIVLGGVALTVDLILYRLAFAWLNQILWWVALYAGITHVMSSGNCSYKLVLAIAPVAIEDLNLTAVTSWWFAASVASWIVLYIVGRVVLYIAEKRGWPNTWITAVRFTAALAAGQLALYECANKIYDKTWTQVLWITFAEKPRISIVFCYTIALLGCAMLVLDLPQVLRCRSFVHQRRILDVD